MHITISHNGGGLIPPPLYGGAQRIVYALGKALIALGHKVTLIAGPGSQLPGGEVLVVPPDKQNEWPRFIPEETDIVHAFSQKIPETRKPVLHTIQGNGAPGEKFPANTVFVSQKHAANHGSKHFVHNSIDPEDYLFSEQRENYAVYLAKARWDVKNFPGAASVARKAGIELRVLGSRNWPLNLQRLLPPIRGLRYYGMLGGREKLEILSRARCLIFPVRWEEPCAVALPEALISGCYVVGTPYGCLPEIVTPDVGVLSTKAADLACVVQNPERFNPKTCRQRGLERFSHIVMAKKYLTYYEMLLTRGTLLEPGENPPATNPGFDPNKLLPWEG